MTATPRWFKWMDLLDFSVFSMFAWKFSGSCRFYATHTRTGSSKMLKLRGKTFEWRSIHFFLALFVLKWASEEVFFFFFLNPPLFKLAEQHIRCVTAWGDCSRDPRLLTARRAVQTTEDCCSSFWTPRRAEQAGVRQMLVPPAMKCDATGRIVMWQTM